MTTGRNRSPGSWAARRSGCTPETTDVFLESAYWDPITIAATGRALKINSDARYRFERGVDPAFTLPGLELATQMILDLCGGEPSEIVQDGAVPRHHARLPLRPRPRWSAWSAWRFPSRPARARWRPLASPLEGDRAVPPTWRPDMLGEADLVEEVARIASLDQAAGQAAAPRQLPGVPKPILTPLQVRERTARRTLASLGYNECVTYSFIDAAAAERCSAAGPMPCASTTRSRPR